MNIHVWGARGAIPSPGPSTYRYGGNTSCVSLWTESSELLVFDAGTGIRQLGRHLRRSGNGHPLSGMLFLSHLHWDHIEGFPHFLSLCAPDSHFTVFSFRPPASTLQGLLTAHMRPPFFPVRLARTGPRIEFCEITEGTIAVGGGQVTTRWLNHPDGCLGFRVESGNRVFTYASDHEPGFGYFDDNLRALAADADVLCLDARYTEEEYNAGQTGSGHGTWQTAVRLAEHASAKRLLFFHHDPDRSDEEMDNIVRQAQRSYPHVEAASEGMEISLPEQEPVWHSLDAPIREWGT